MHERLFQLTCDLPRSSPLVVPFAICSTQPTPDIMPRMSHFAANLAALDDPFPTLAARLRTCSLPEEFEATTGTDGSRTFCRSYTLNHQKRREWLGGTSMPAASAGPITASLDAGGPTGLGLSIGTGHEWGAFIGRLPRQSLVYVYEPDVALLCMALHICDLSAQLAARRLILLPGDGGSAAQALADFLNANPGFDPPTVLHPLTTLVGERRHLLLSAGEAIVRHAVTTRQVRSEQLQQEIAASPHLTGAGAGASLAFFLTPRHLHERSYQDAISARSAATVYIDRHDSASPTLRLQLLAQHLKQGPVRVVSDLLRPQLGMIPAEVKVETWVPPLVGPGFWDRLPAAAEIAPGDGMVVSFGLQKQLLQDRRFPGAQISVRRLAPAAHARGEFGAPPFKPSAARLALVADLAPSDAAALGIVLPTHQSVFAAARELITEDYLTVHHAMAPDVLRRALIRAGVDPRTTDPALKEPMLRLIRDVVIPAVPVLTLIAHLARQGHPLTLIGDFPGLQTTLADIRMIPLAAYTVAAWQEVALYVHFSPQGNFSQHVWDAVAAGVPVIAPQHPADRFPTEADAGTLPGMLKANVDFAHPPAKQFFAALKGLLHNSEQRQKLAAGAARALVDGTPGASA